MPAAGLVPEFDTVILAGGSATRMAGADKPGLTVGGRAMLVSVAEAAATAGTGRLIIVGPPRGGPVQEALDSLAATIPGGLTLVQEEPAGGGPVLGLRRGLAEIAASWIAVLAADLPFLSGHDLTALLAAGQAAGVAGAVLADDNGEPQWLAGGWHADTLRAALGGYRGNSLRGLMEPLRPLRTRPDTAACAAPPWLDCDTPDELAAARSAWLAGRLADPNGAL